MNTTKHSRERRGSRLWLYPISENSNYWFKVGEKKLDPSPDSFREIMEASSGIDRWSIRHHRTRAHIGHEIVVYSCMTNERPPLLIGVGRIVKEAYWVDSWTAWAIKIKWNRRGSLALCHSPVDATYLKDRLPQRKSAVLSLSPDLVTWTRRALGRVLGKSRPQ